MKKARTRDARFEALAESASDLIACCDTEGRWTHLSPSVERLLGYRAAELVGHSATDLVHPEDRERVVAAFARLAHGDESPAAFEYRLVRRDGETVWVETRPVIWRDPSSGEVIEVHSAFRDVTAHRKAERAFAEREEHFRLLGENMSDIATRFDMSGAISYISPSVRAILGYVPEEMIGRTTWEFILKEDHPHVAAAFQALIGGAEGALSRIEYRVRRADGSIRYLEANPKPIRRPTGEIVEFFDVARDITERKAAEAALQAALTASEAARREAAENEARFRMLAESARDITLQISPAGEILYVSPAVRSLGYEPEALIGADITSYIHPEDVATAAAAVARLLSGGVGEGGERDEFRILRKDGGFVWLEGNPAVVRTESGEVVNITTSLRDISDRRALEDSLVAARLQAEAAATAKAEFLANMSHELRTPLTSVIGFAQLIQGEPALSENVRRAADRITAGGKALLAIVNDVLDFSKIESGDIQVDPTPTPIDPLLRDAVELLRLSAEEKGLDLTVTGLETLPPFVRVDANRVRQVLLNLVGNAVKFSEQGKVEIVARYDPGHEDLSIRVIDQGIGIPAEKLGDLFQRFRQMDSSISRRFGGTGLGLAITKGLVEAMGGELGVESVEGEGSTFWFRIPAPACSQLDMTRGGPDQEHLLAGRRVLVVDDNSEALEVISVILGSCDVAVDCAPDGPAALEAIARQVYDAILMDYRMPRMDGVAAAKAIRYGTTRNRFTPILMCTSDGELAGGEEAVLIDGVILKPVTPANLLGGLAAVLDDDPFAVMMTKDATG